MLTFLFIVEHPYLPRRLRLVNSSATKIFIIFILHPQLGRSKNAFTKPTFNLLHSNQLVTFLNIYAHLAALIKSVPRPWFEIGRKFVFRFIWMCSIKNIAEAFFGSWLWLPFYFTWGRALAQQKGCFFVTKRSQVRVMKTVSLRLRTIDVPLRSSKSREPCWLAVFLYLLSTWIYVQRMIRES